MSHACTPTSAIVALALALALAVQVACVAPMDTSSDEWALSSPCPPWGCGTNTAYVHTFPVEELHLGGTEWSRSLLRIAAFVDPTNRKWRADGQGRFIATGDLSRFGWHERLIRLHVRNGVFETLDRYGRVLLTGRGIVGSELGVQHISGWGFAVEFRSIAKVALWARRPSCRTMSTSNPNCFTNAYGMMVERPNGGKEYMCQESLIWGEYWGEEPSVPTVKGSDGLYALDRWTTYGRLATLIKGETYDYHTGGPVKTGITGEPWFNFACAGSALAKMKLMGYDPESTGCEATSPAQRGSALKMITARYCGAASFTQDGIPLMWNNPWNWFKAPPIRLPGGGAREQSWASWWNQRRHRVGTVMESVWDNKGAICLSSPRIQPRSTVQGTCKPTFRWCTMDDIDMSRPVSSPPPGDTPTCSKSDNPYQWYTVNLP